MQEQADTQQVYGLFAETFTATVFPETAKWDQEGEGDTEKEDA